MNPRNIGVVENADAVGMYCDEPHSTTFHFYLTINNACITNVTFQTYGCAASIAASSMITVLVKGKKLTDAFDITAREVSDALGGMPASKMFIIQAAIEALTRAITQYQEKKSE
ncbi:MAG: iron-sulfur cluster assembly scaffold protein [Candidatus Omnitrophica bacterium]|nr:iron-sulfur cluster assembly scaffold protein [Candidatus Omnitrophota bacterium]